MSNLARGTPGSPLRSLAVLREGKSRRISSFDPTGGNRDYRPIPAGEKLLLARIPGSGCINHIWATIACADPHHLRKIVLRAWWDGEEHPSIETPVGDFFGIGYSLPHYWASLPLTVSYRAMNCFFPMPFGDGARLEIANEGDVEVGAFYYYVDYEEWPAPPENMGRFHCQWRRENPCRGQDVTTNTTGDENYVIMEAEGRGHYVGCVMHIHGLQSGWWGEGDDMIYIDGEGWPPSLHGTGLEDYFCGAWNFNELNREYCTPYHGFSRKGNDDYTGKHSMYRFHIEDPVIFEKSIRVTIEHGHANRRSDDYSSTAYWYQTEPHKPFPPLLPVEQRVPNEHATLTPVARPVH